MPAVAYHKTGLDIQVTLDRGGQQTPVVTLVTMNLKIVYRKSMNNLSSTCGFVSMDGYSSVP